MNTFFKFSMSLLASMVFFSTASFAQIDFSHPKFAAYGSTPQECEANYTNYSFFRDDIKLGNVDSAIKRLDSLIASCPDCNENIYIIGSTMYKKLYAKAAGDEAKRTEYIDRIMELYDLRDANFGDQKAKNRGSKVILANKALDMMRYRPSNIPDLRKAVALAISKSGANVNLDMLQQYFNIVSNEYISNEAFDAADLLNDFDLVTSAVTLSVSDVKSQAQRNIDELLLQSGAASCENLEKLFKPQFEADSNNPELISKIMGYLVRNECQGNFATTLSEKYYAISPTSDSAFALALAFASKGEDAKAVKYFKEAVEADETSAFLPKFYVRFSGHELIMGRPMTAATYAKKAISLDPKSSLGYMLLAQSYALGTAKAECDGFSKKAIFLLIVDNLNKAKSYTSGPDETAKINGMIKTYSPHFPTAEDVFFMDGLAVGGSYTVSCGWIKGVTKIRTSN